MAVVLSVQTRATLCWMSGREALRANSMANNSRRFKCKSRYSGVHTLCIVMSCKCTPHPVKEASVVMVTWGNWVQKRPSLQQIPDIPPLQR